MKRFGWMKLSGQAPVLIARWCGGSVKVATRVPPGPLTVATLRAMVEFIAANREDGIDPPTGDVLLGLYKSRRVQNRIRKKLLRLAAAELLGG